MIDGWSCFLLIFCGMLEKDREGISETVGV